MMSDSSCDNCDLSLDKQPQPSSSSSSSLVHPQTSDLVSLCQGEDASHSQQHQQQQQQQQQVKQPLAFASASDTSSSSPGDHNNQPIIDECDSTLVPRDLNKLAQDKEAVYKHPLFPLLALLLEKCEYATATLGQQTAPAFTKESTNVDSNDDDSSISPPSSPVEHVKPASSLLVSPAQQSFNQQVQAFVDLHEKQGKPLLVEDEEVNTLMIKAIQVLRINLLELEKVQELCKDFCQRYITCLRTKMSSENLLRGTTAFGSGGHGGLGFDASSRSSSPSSDDNSMPPAHPHHSRHQRRMSSLRNPYDSYSSGKQDMSPLESGQQVDSISQHMSFDANDVQRDSGNEGDLSDDAASNAYHGSDGNGGGRNGGHGSASAKQKTASKRGILPKQATSIMRSWLFQHIVHPYPTEDEKRAIAAQTNLTLLQVNNWFINARRRILQPMLDSANTVGNSENNSNNSSSANGTNAPATNGSNNNNNNTSSNNNGKLSIALSSPPSNGSNEVTSKKLKTTSQQPKPSISGPQIMWSLDAISPRSSTD